MINQKLIGEVVRIAMRYISVLLMTLGAPEWLSAPFADPALVGLVVGVVVVIVTESWWIDKKVAEK